MPPRQTHALPAGYRLHWYVIESVLGQGGFGITYLARDTNLDQPVAIKEYLPVTLATRSEDSQVHPISENHTDTYGWGMNRFMDEARTLAKFRHPNIVTVHSVFEANQTAYMVMQYEDGESLENALKFGRLREEQDLRALLDGLLDGLERVHAMGFIHRDIKPDNIYIRTDGSPVLLDFGSARQALGSQTSTLTALVTPGYAPVEQYDSSRDDGRKQGPWTDIYSLGATLYRAVTRKPPPDAISRVGPAFTGADSLAPAAQAAQGEYSTAFTHAIDRALAFLPAQRPQTIHEWQIMLAGDAGIVEAQDQDAVTRVAPTTRVEPASPPIAAGDRERATEQPRAARDPDPQPRFAADDDDDDPEHALDKLKGAAWIEGNVLWALGMLSVGFYYYFATRFVLRRSEALIALVCGEADPAPPRASLLAGLYGLGLAAHAAGIGSGVYFAWLILHQDMHYERAASAALLWGCVSLWVATAIVLVWFWLRARHVATRNLDLDRRGVELPANWRVTSETLAHSTVIMQRVLVFLAFFALDIYLITMLHAMIVGEVTRGTFAMDVMLQGLGLMIGLSMLLLIGGFVLIKTQIWLLLAPQGRDDVALALARMERHWARTIVTGALWIRSRIDWFWVLLLVNLALAAIAFYLVHRTSLILIFGGA